MSYTIHLRHNPTGETRTYVEKLDWSLFWWQEGNMSCDCNRHLTWLRAGGPGPSDDPHHNNADRDCGEGEYTVTHATLDTGEVVPVDAVPA